MMKRLALAAIGFYQRFISPYKGFSCAYRVHTGRASCSALGRRAIERFGVRKGIGVLRLRLTRCGDTHRHHAARNPTLRHQAGFVDCACDVPDLSGCDVPDLSCDLPDKKACEDAGKVCDVLSNCGSGCDFGNFWSPRKKREEEARN
jgi:putative component of membrane protein insertase Oxa1/YidC/SpoIIIJ protein YidD